MRDAKQRRSERERALWTAGAVLLFVVTALWLQADVWRLGFDRVVPSSPGGMHAAARAGSQIDLNLSDQRFVVWAVARNAYTLVTRPASLFDSEMCYPEEHTLAMGPPAISLGMLGVPAWIATGDPVATYNFTLIAMNVLAALAMFWLVRDWTGSAAAGVAAGLLFAFAPAKIGLGFVTRPMITDTGWTVLAIFLARRFFARGRWRDGIGLALACATQLSADFYPLLAGALAGLPVFVWMLVHYRFRNLRPAPCAAASLLLLAAAAWILAPYLELSDSVIRERDIQLFASWASLLPGAYVGWPTFLLALTALFAPRARALAGLDGDPRWALLLALAGVALMATGGNAAAQVSAALEGESVPALPNPYAAIATLVPGLRAVRLPMHLVSGVHLLVSLLAGLGAAVLIGLVPRRLATAGGLAMVALVWGITLSSRPAYRVLEMRPPPQELALFRELDRLGNSGPLLEVPIKLDWAGYQAMDASQQVLLTSYHHRRTSGCYASFGPPILKEIERLAADLPQRRAVRALSEMGFTTLIVRRTPPTRHRRSYARKIERAAEAPHPPLRLLHAGDELAAYELLP